MLAFQTYLWKTDLRPPLDVLSRRTVRGRASLALKQNTPKRKELDTSSFLCQGLIDKLALNLGRTQEGDIQLGGKSGKGKTGTFSQHFRVVQIFQWKHENRVYAVEGNGSQTMLTFHPILPALGSMASPPARVQNCFSYSSVA